MGGTGGILCLKPGGVSREDSFAVIWMFYQGICTPSVAVPGVGRQSSLDRTLAGMLCGGGEGKGRKNKSLSLTSFALLHYAFPSLPLSLSSEFEVVFRCP